MRKPFLSDEWFTEVDKLIADGGRSEDSRRDEESRSTSR